MCNIMTIYNRVTSPPHDIGLIIQHTNSTPGYQCPLYLDTIRNEDHMHGFWANGVELQKSMCFTI